jgi:hypothetical protein
MVCHVDICRNIGGTAAIGIGIGAAFAASMGSIGYGLGLLAAVGMVLASRALRAHRL